MIKSEPLSEPLAAIHVCFAFRTLNSIRPYTSRQARLRTSQVTERGSSTIHHSHSLVTPRELLGKTSPISASAAHDFRKARTA